MDKSIEELEKDLDTMNEIFRKYVRLSLTYEEQINNADLSDDQRKELLDKLSRENEKVQKAKLQIEKFERTIQSLKDGTIKMKTTVREMDKSEYLVAYN
ncbi:hypothetical protein V7O66_10035 [Methanolobus sp. ZRKC3]|uniref:hypothetical protein n=1 Tax=Methanolobus sp. ZRKC3 TaxID=3125786 RepID=UPI00324B528B